MGLYYASQQNWIAHVSLGSIATETRCPRYVRSSLNFRHDVAASRTSKWAMNRHCSTANVFEISDERLPNALSRSPFVIIIVRYETVHDMHFKPLHCKGNF